jgi:hypothetical protein
MFVEKEEYNYYWHDGFNEHKLNLMTYDEKTKMYCAHINCGLGKNTHAYFDINGLGHFVEFFINEKGNTNGRITINNRTYNLYSSKLQNTYKPDYELCGRIKKNYEEHREKLQREQEIKLQREQEIKLQREREIREQEIKLQREQEIKLQREQEIKLQREQEIKLQKEQQEKILREEYIIVTDNTDEIINFKMNGQNIIAEFDDKQKQLITELSKKYNIVNNGYFIFADKKIKEDGVLLDEKDSFKIFIKVKGKYMLHIFFKICTLLEKYFDSCKFVSDIFRKRGEHKKFTSYYEINDPTIVVYFTHSTKKQKKTLFGDLYVYEEAQAKMITFIEKLNDLIGYDYDKYCKKEYKNEHRYRKKANSSEIFIDYLQPENQEGPSFTKKFNDLVNYCQGGYTETNKNHIMDKLGHNYFNGDITDISIKNNANVLVEFMEKFDGEFFYKNKDTYDILCNYQFKKAIEETKNLEFKTNNLLWTHNRTINVFCDQITGKYGDDSINSLIGKYYNNKGVSSGLNFRYGLDSQYGSIVFIMNPNFYDNINSDDFRLFDGVKLGKKTLTNLFSVENTGEFTSDGDKDVNQLLFENTMKLKINSYITNFRNDVISTNPLCDDLPSIIKSSIDNITEHLMVSDKYTTDKSIFEHLVGHNNLINKHLLNYDIINKAKSQKTWCNYQIQLYENFDIAKHVYKILIPNNIDDNIKEIISKNQVYSVKTIYVDIDGTNWGETNNENYFKYRRNPHNMTVYGNSSMFTFLPKDFEKYEKEYYNVIDELIRSNKMIGGNYKKKYIKYMNK